MDISLFADAKGQGFPLIFLHGNGESHAYFENQIEAFSSDYRVIAIDTRGHGNSPRGAEPFTISQFAKDLLAFMDERQIEKAHLLGFSDGANIALLFAMAYPTRVGKLILNGVNLNPWGVKPWVQLPIVLGYGAANLFAKKSEKAHRRAELLGLMVHEPHIKPEELHDINVQTLVIAGTRDMILRCHTRLIAKSIPGAQLVLIRGNHFVANQNPKEFNQAVETFLKQP